MNIEPLGWMPHPVHFIPAERRHRSPGLHLTAILDAMEERGFIPSRKSSTIDERSLNAAAGVGFLWEEVLERALADQARLALSPEIGLHRCGEVICNGIAMSPDGVAVVELKNLAAEGCLIEYKCTWSGTKKGIDQKARWLLQANCYCHALGFTLARFYVLHVCGNRQGGYFPELRAWQIRYTREDLDGCWAEVLRVGKEEGLL